MAHSIEIYKGKAAIINDLDLLVIISFGVDVIHENPDFIGFKDMEIHWRNCIPQYGPGLIHLGIQQFLITPNKEEEFRLLLLAIVERVSRYGEIIPAQNVNNMVGLPDVIFADYQVFHVKEALEKLITLLAGNGLSPITKD